MNPLAALRRLVFASRKVRLPIPKNALVLEVGSGDSPCPRSDVLLDYTLDDFERVGGRTVVDRPLVLGLVERLPFRNKAFDYAIAFHVLEHSPDPVAFLSELQRVARAGYIETPAYWAERIQPLTMHRLEVGVEDDGGAPRLVINQKAAPVPDCLLASQFAGVLEPWAGFDRLNPAAWVTRYHWRGEIKYRILNPGQRSDWPSPPEATHANGRDPRPLARRIVKRAAQSLGRRRAVELLPLLRCPDCFYDKLEDSPLRCPKCGRRFELVGGVPSMHPQNSVTQA